MKRTPRSFIFKNYSFDPQKGHARFTYAMTFKGEAEMEFVENIHLPKKVDMKGMPDGLLEKVLQNVHLILGISYYKLFCPAKVEMPYVLTTEQAEFWTTVYRKGLGEFAYRNGLDQRKFAKFPGKKGAVSTVSFPRKNRSLLGIGGGKDSIVAGELLKAAKKDFDGFLVETGRSSEIVQNVAKVMGAKSVQVKRNLDKKLFRKIKGALNGHVPISAVFAFLGLLTAVLYDYRYVIVGNEHSSNFGNVKWKGEEVNHQWSKSLEFERMFQDYVRKFVTPDVTYFSLLRPFYEIRIAEIFAGMKKYFSVFSSCNRMFRAHKEVPKGGSEGKLRLRRVWCGACAKCAFVFTLLAAHLPKKEVVKIFGKDLSAEEHLKPLFKDLLGEGKMKPFDCVGTFEEMRAAYRMMRGEKTDRGEVFKAQDSAGPTEFKLIGMKTVLLLGYGKEGKATHAFLKKKFPKLKVGMADQKDGIVSLTRRSFGSSPSVSKNYLKKQDDFDLVIKTPGISKRFVTRPYTTASNLFFAGIGVRGNTVVGVTGSKGKSTTASLIAHLLKVGGKKVSLLGNIGKPMLSALLKPTVKGEIFVLELSSYQLEDLEFSPNIAVVTNLFPEHMDYHGGEKNYYEAKKNIFRHQGKDDLLVFNDKNKILKAWAKEATNAVAFVKALPVKELPLIGEHNEDNVRAAVTVAQLLGVKESAIKKGVLSFKALPHRLEKVGTFKEVTFYDDAISTTPESTIMALKALKNTDTIFLGGEDRGYKFAELEKTLRKMKVRNVVLFPDTGERMLKSNKGFKILRTRSMKEAVKFAFEMTKPGKVALLSCASPSYSLWENFEEKGDEFQKWIRYNKST